MKAYYDVINAILTQKRILPVTRRLNKSAFNGYKEPRLVYDFITEYFGETKEIPTPYVVEERFPFFKYEEVFGNIDQYIDLIIRDRYQREYKQSLLKMMNYDEEMKQGGLKPRDVHRRAANLLSKLGENLQQENTTVDISKNVEEYFEKYKEKATGSRGGIQTYIPDLDKYIRLLPGHLIYMFGRPGCGKTWTALYMAKEMAKRGIKPMIFTYEMEQDAIDDRIFCLEAGVNYTRLVLGTLTDEELEELRRVKIKWEKNNCTSLLVRHSIDEDISHIESNVIEEDPDIIFVDYIDLIENIEKGLATKESIAKKSRGLKKIAARRKIPVVVISHSNRDFVKTNKNKEEKTDKLSLPQLENIANADECGKDADLVIGLHSDDIEETVDDKKIFLYKKILIGVVKGRFFKPCQTLLKMDLDCGTIQQLEEKENKAVLNPPDSKNKTTGSNSSTNNITKKETSNSVNSDVDELDVGTIDDANVSNASGAMKNYSQ